MRGDFRRFSASLSDSALGEMISVAVHFGDANMVGDTIQQCASQMLGPKRLRPFAKGKIACDQVTDSDVGPLKANILNIWRP